MHINSILEIFNKIRKNQNAFKPRRTREIAANIIGIIGLFFVIADIFFYFSDNDIKALKEGILIFIFNGILYIFIAGDNTSPIIRYPFGIIVLIFFIYLLLMIFLAEWSIKSICFLFTKVPIFNAISKIVCEYLMLPILKLFKKFIGLISCQIFPQLENKLKFLFE